MISNLTLRKKLMQLGITTVALVNGAVCLGCNSVEAQEEEVQSMVAIATVENNNDKDEVVNTASIPTPVLTSTPISTPVRTNTPDPTSTPYDPYTLTDEEAIEMGTYIYENYVSKYALDPDSSAAYRTDHYGKEDMINYVCLLNQKYPALYPDRDSACENGNMFMMTSIYEMLLNGVSSHTERVEGNKIFPFSLLLKDGRPEKALLEELESDFEYITNNNVSNEEIYKYWGKVCQLAINVDETLKDWNQFNYLMFYYAVKSQFYYSAHHSDKYNNFDLYLPSEYVFANKKGVKLDIFAAFSMRNSISRNQYSRLSDQEFNAYVGCFEEFAAQCDKYNEDNYIVKRIREKGE